MKRITLLLLMAALSPISMAIAADAPATISALQANGARVVELGARGGLDGYLVEPAAGDPYSLYLTPDGHAVAGLLYGPDGNLITGEQIAAAQDLAADTPMQVAHATEGAAPHRTRKRRSNALLRLSASPSARPVPSSFCSATRPAAGRARRRRGSAGRRSTVASGCM